jgi:hypothetical protein
MVLLLACSSLYRRHFACAFRKSYPNVMVVQPRQDWDGHNGAGPLHYPARRRVFTQDQVRVHLIVIRLAIDQHPIEALAPHGLDQGFQIRILPRSWRINPARTTASVRVLTPSFKKIRLTCDFTVSGEISRPRAMRLLEKPWLIIARTTRSLPTKFQLVINLKTATAGLPIALIHSAASLTQRRGPRPQPSRAIQCWRTTNEIRD